MRKDDAPPGSPRAKPENTSRTVGTGSTVDLGEDLLTGSRTMLAPGDPFASQSPSDEYHSARILLSEGLVEDAKRLLRKILIGDPSHAAARQSLGEILDRELKELLASESPASRPRSIAGRPKRRGTERSRSASVSADELVRELDRELGLGISRDLSAAHPRFTGDFSGATASDRMDLGIAFLEMELCEPAIAHFRAALELLGGIPDLDRPRWLAATALLARAFLAANQPFEAIQLLHPVVRDAETPWFDKLEFLYLMGVAQAMTGGRQAALPWFEKVRELDPYYRDISEKIRKALE